MPDAIERADRELNELLDCLSPDDRKLASAAARSIYSAALAQEREQAEAYRVEMVKAQEECANITHGYDVLRDDLHEAQAECQRLRVLCEALCPTVNLNEERKG